MCVCVLLIWGTNKLVGWLLLGCGIKKACLAVGGGGRKGRGVLLWKTTGDGRRGWRMKEQGRATAPGSGFESKVGWGDRVWGGGVHTSVKLQLPLDMRDHN